MASGIYSIRNVINNNVYIGSAVNFIKRKNNHFNCLSKNKHKNIHLQRAYNKYGKDNFEFEIISYVEDKTKLVECEQKWLDFFKPEYNMCKIAGSTLGVKLSEEHKEKIRLNNLGKHNHTYSDESKLKMSLSKIGTKRSQETKDKIKQTMKEKRIGIGSNNGMFGKTPWNKKENKIIK